MREVGHYRDGVNSQKGIDMTELGQGEGQSFGNSAPAAPASSSAAPQGGSEERTFRQHEVNDIVSRRTAEAVERYKRETSIASHQPSQQQQQSGNQPQHYQAPQQPTPPPPQYNGLSEHEARRIAAEEAQRSRTEWAQEAQRTAEQQNAERITSEFFTKVGTGDGGVQGFHKLVADAGLDLRAIPYHVQLANMVDNTRDVMVELVNNPSKIGIIQNLIDIDLRAGRQPNLALAEMKRLSTALKANSKASNFKAPQDPLSQMRPSNAGTDNKGALTVSDYKRKYRV